MPRETGMSWSTSRPVGGTLSPPAKTVAIAAIVHLAGANRGIDSDKGPVSGWAGMSVNREDPVEMELAADIHEELHVFRGLNGRLVAQSPGRTEPGPLKITYDQFLRYLSLWFSGVLGTSVANFRKQFATQSGRSGSVSVVANAGVTCELWGQHEDWRSKRHNWCT